MAATREAKIIAAVYDLHYNNIRYLTLTNLGLTDGDAEMIAEAIGHDPNLEKLNLSANQFTDKGYDYLIKAVSKHPNKKLKFTCLAARALIPTYPRTEFKTEGIAMQEQRIANTRLDLSKLTEGDINEKLKKIRENKNCEELILSKWKKFQELTGTERTNAVKILADSIASLKKLETLRLDGISLNDDDVAELSLTIQEHAKLKQIFLQHNKIGAVGAMSLVECLNKNKNKSKDKNSNIIRLHIAHNQVSDEGGIDLAFCVMTWKKFELHADFNEISESGITKIKEHFSKNKGIKFTLQQDDGFSKKITRVVESKVEGQSGTTSLVSAALSKNARKDSQSKSAAPTEDAKTAALVESIVSGIINRVTDDIAAEEKRKEEKLANEAKAIEVAKMNGEREAKKLADFEAQLDGALDETNKARKMQIQMMTEQYVNPNGIELGAFQWGSKKKVGGFHETIQSADEPEGGFLLRNEEPEDAAGLTVTPDDDDDDMLIINVPPPSPRMNSRG